MKTFNRNTELISHIIDGLKDGRAENCFGCDLHNELFNTDYFIISPIYTHDGTYEAEQWLIENGGIFNAIKQIKDYEQSNFGAVNTDLSSAESVCNMITYIWGEEILSNSEVLRENWDNRLDEETIALLITEFDEM